MRQTVEVDVLTTPEATVVEVKGSSSLETYRGNLVAQGFAKKHPNDSHDPEVGHALAMSRALKDLAALYEKRAWDRINANTTTTKFAIGGMVTDTPKYSMEISGKLDRDNWWRSIAGVRDMKIHTSS